MSRYTLRESLTGHDMSVDYDYREAVSRNIGWVTEAEQAILRTRRIAIAGLGGVGGSHLLTLARLGIGHFRIADPDVFEVANFNRQAGAFLSTVGRPKITVLEEMAREINPTIAIETFAEGATSANVERFLEGVDLYVDGLDFFAVEARRMVFAACAERAIPAVTAAPLGMGAAVLNFLPGGMSFEEYFRLEGHEPHEQLIRFLIGLSPTMLQRGYLVEPSAVDLLAGRGPSTPMACEVCAGAAAAEALKILLNRGPVRTAPRGTQYDPYRNRLARTWRPGGNGNPLQRLAIAVARRQLARMRAAVPPPERDPVQPQTVVEQILDLARWAPSGDNAQPWRFEQVTEREFLVHWQDEAETNVYDFNNGQPTWLAIGCLLESLQLAANKVQFETSWDLRESSNHRHSCRVKLTPSDAVRPDPLADRLRSRSVNRRAYRLTRLTDAEKVALQASILPSLKLCLFEDLRGRWRWARIASQSTAIRLAIPETFPIHQRILDFSRDFSPEGIPARAVGLDPVTQRLMRWAFQRRQRLDLLNRYLFGTLLPRIQLDLFPGIFSAAFLTLEIRNRSPRNPPWQALLEAGMSLQRLWLTADQLGLAMQPLLAPLAFSHYGAEGKTFTVHAAANAAARRIAGNVSMALGRKPSEATVVLARIGTPRSGGYASRSVRRPLDQLLTSARPRGENGSGR